MHELDIPVTGGTLRALRFGDGSRLALAAHGITASAMSFATVARHMPAGWSLVAVDLRGRGGSAGLPGPYGMSAHAADLCKVAAHLGAPVALAGQSMGAYAALRAAALRPELFTRLLMIDGGLPLPVPPGADPDQVLLATVGPAITRLSETYGSVDEYIAFFRAHPAMAGDWNDDMAEYARYDAVSDGTVVRSRTSAAAVSADGRDLLVSAASFGEDLAGLQIPAHLLYAPRGMFGQPPGVLPPALVEAATVAAPALSAEPVDDCNHYTILMTDRPAALIAQRLTAPQG